MLPLLLLLFVVLLSRPRSSSLLLSCPPTFAAARRLSTSPPPPLPPFRTAAARQSSSLSCFIPSTPTPTPTPRSGRSNARRRSRNRSTISTGVGASTARAEAARLSAVLDAAASHDEGDVDPGGGTADGSTASGPHHRRLSVIPPETIERIKSMADVVSVVESHDLPGFVRTGPGKAKVLCPFHDDNNPSMSVDANRGLYKCFACGEGGDVFRFVREYRHLRDGGDKMNFPRSVEVVAREYTDGSVELHGGSSGGWSGTKREPLSEEGRRRMADREAKKKRILLANAAAADFYGKCLATLPAAGAARSHLRNRGVSPATVRTFALGYAPDAYFGAGARVSRRRRKRMDRAAEGGRTMADDDAHAAAATAADGSLVQRLAELGFDPQEIVDAGLATRTTKKGVARSDVFLEEGRKNAEGNVKGSVNANKTAPAPDGKNKTEEIDYSSLMDRFRGRLMVPIFDEDGRNVIAFGGRYLEAPGGSNSGGMSSSNFKAAKYLNSPESLVFSKKTVLFGTHNAKAAVDTQKSSPTTSTGGVVSNGAKPDEIMQTSTLVIVEGYFDAIALANAGVEEVAASMGTALSIHQLEVAAKTVGAPGGRIVLCLDRDDAGLNAVERLCSGNVLTKASDTLQVEIYVATLPDGMKDPAEFVEQKGGDVRSGEAFRADVLESARLWSDWYLDRITLHYQAEAVSGAKGSFSEICDRVAGFLATIANLADRTRRAYEVAGTLSDVIVSGTGGSPNALRIQLESDLLDMASRKAGAREAIQRRIESADGYVGDNSADIMAKMSSGEGVRPELPAHTSEHKSFRESRENKTPSPPMLSASNKQSRKARNALKRYASPDRISQSRSRRKETTSPPPLVPHFRGFDFANKYDEEWLGISSKESKRKRSDLVLGAGSAKSDGGSEAHSSRQGDVRKKTHDIVYFNSNGFLGEKFLTVTAKNAGYGGGESRTKGRVLQPTNIAGGGPLQLMTSSILEPDADKMLLAAEDRLLRSLVNFSAARVAMKAALATSIQSGAQNNPSLIEWSSPEREWLFRSLVDSPGLDPLPSELQDGGTVVQLHQHLASRRDAPEGAFREVHCGTLASRNGEIFLTTSEGDEGAGHLLDAVAGIEEITGNKAVSGGSNDFPTISSEHDDGFPDTEDVEGWAASYDPTIFLDDDSSSGLSAVQNVSEDVFPSSGSERNKANADEPVVDGMLDMFFMPENNHFADSFAELTVQETLAIMLKATAIKRMTSAKKQWSEATCALLKRKDEDSSSGHQFPANNEGHDAAYKSNVMVSKFDEMDLAQLESICSRLGTDLVEASRAVHHLDISAQRVSSRLLDYSVTEGVEFKMSAAKQDALDKMLEEHIASLPEDRHRPTSPGDDGSYVFGSDEFEDFIDPMFGGRGALNEEKGAAEQDDQNWQVGLGAPQEAIPFDHDSIFE